jgi:hypothetical protein
MPEVTEVWATAYLQILVLVFVFALGVPALLFQLIVPEDVRQVVHHRWRISGWYAFTFVLALASVLFVWMLHPHASASAPLTAFPLWKSLIANAIVTLVPLMTAFAGLLLFISYKRDRVIQRLEKSLETRYSQTGTWDAPCLQDLLFLGEQGKPGREKELVLNAIVRLAIRAQSQRYYVGCELEELIRGVESVITAQQLGSEKNFCLAAEFLDNIWAGFLRSNTKMYLDAEAAILTLKELSVCAALYRSESTALIFLNTVAAIRPEILLELGMAALNSKSFLIATAALNKLEALTERPSSMTFDEHVANLLGLLACFYSAGTSAQRRCNQFLSRAQKLFSPSLDDCLGSAVAYHYRNSNYVVSDNLSVLRSAMSSVA